MGEAGGFGPDQLHFAASFIHIRATPYGSDPGWNGWDGYIRTNVINHEVGHSLGLAEHYQDDARRGSVGDASVYSGVMDFANDLDYGYGTPSDTERQGAWWSVWGWY